MQMKSVIIRLITDEEFNMLNHVHYRYQRYSL